MFMMSLQRQTKKKINLRHKIVNKSLILTLYFSVRILNFWKSSIQRRHVYISNDRMFELLICINPTPPSRTGCYKRLIFKPSLTCLNSEFYF